MVTHQFERNDPPPKKAPHLKVSCMNGQLKLHGCFFVLLYCSKHYCLCLLLCLYDTLIPCLVCVMDCNVIWEQQYKYIFASSLVYLSSTV